MKPKFTTATVIWLELEATCCVELGMGIEKQEYLDTEKSVEQGCSRRK